MSRKSILVSILVMLLFFSVCGCNKKNSEVDKYSSPTNVVKSYLKCDNVDDLLNHVLDNENLESTIRTYYETNKLPSVEKDLKLEAENLDDTNITLVSTRYNNTDHFYFVQKIDGKYMINWKLSVLYTEKSWEEFKASKRKIPTEFMCAITLDDYYNYEFRNKDKEYWSFELGKISYKAKDGCISIGLNGYVKKNSDIGKELFNLTKDGKPHILILKLQYNTFPDNNTNCVLISDIVVKNLSELIK